MTDSPRISDGNGDKLEPEDIMKMELDEFELLIVEQKQRFENHLRFSHDSALTYNCTESEPEDWVDTHEKTA